MFLTTILRKFPTRCCALFGMLFAMVASSSSFAATTTIVAKHSGKCLDVRGGVTATADGARIEQWACSGQANQAWTLKDMGGAQYEIIASNSGKCIDILNGGTANGTAIQQLSCTGQTKQRWKLNSQGSGQYQIISVSSGRCLDVTGGTGATGDGVLTELWDCTGQANQSWKLSAPTTTTTQLIHTKSGKCLDVTGGPAATGNGVPIEQWACTGQSNQAWTVRDMGDFKYEFIASNSGKCLTVIGGDLPPYGSPIQQMDCTGQPNQIWRVGVLAPRRFQLRSEADVGAHCLNPKYDNGWPTNDGAPVELGACGAENDTSIGWTMDLALPIKVTNNSKDFCLDVRGGVQATADGALVEVWSCTGLANQSWTAKDMGNGKVQFVASHSGKCLDLVGGGTGDGNKLQQSQCANTPTQLWTSETSQYGFSQTRIKSVAANSQSCLDIVGGVSAAADGVLTQLKACTVDTPYWTLGKGAYWP
jgi:hypothetical protein